VIGKRFEKRGIFSGIERSSSKNSMKILVNVLLLRPCRWAKSTTLTMTKYFFNVNNPKLATELFYGTQIESEQDFVKQYQAQFPVISMSFGECRAKTWEKMEPLLNSMISSHLHKTNFCMRMSNINLRQYSMKTLRLSFHWHYETSQLSSIATTRSESSCSLMSMIYQ